MREMSVIAFFYLEFKRPEGERALGWGWFGLFKFLWVQTKENYNCTLI